MKQPFLVGEHVYVRGLREEDLEGNYVQWLNDAEVCRHNSHHVFPYSRERAAAYIRSACDSQTALVLAIILKEQDEHIGNISLQNINYVNSSAEFAILLGEKAHWGKGYAKEAAMLLLQHGFMELNLHRIYCATSADNVSMQHLAECLGMVEEGRRREALFKRGKYVDAIEYGVLASEFLNK